MIKKVTEPISVRVTPELKQKVVKQAESENRSTSNFVTKVLTEAVNKKGK